MSKITKNHQKGRFGGSRRYNCMYDWSFMEVFRLQMFFVIYKKERCDYSALKVNKRVVNALHLDVATAAGAVYAEHVTVSPSKGAKCSLVRVPLMQTCRSGMCPALPTCTKCSMEQFPSIQICQDGLCQVSGTCMACSAMQARSMQTCQVSDAITIHSMFLDRHVVTLDRGSYFILDKVHSVLSTCQRPEAYLSDPQAYLTRSPGLHLIQPTHTCQTIKHEI